MRKITTVVTIVGMAAGLGAAVLPLSSYAVADAPTEWGVGSAEGVDYGTNADGTKWVKSDAGVTLTVEDVLSISASTDSIDLSNDDNTGSLNVTVVTNNANGYNLNIKASGTKDDRASALLNEAGDDGIGRAIGSFERPEELVSGSYSRWGVRVVNNNPNLTAAKKNVLKQYADNPNLYMGPQQYGDEIVNVTAPTGEAGDVTTLDFKAVIKDGQAAGLYKGQITLTATNNPAPTPAEP